MDRHNPITSVNSTILRNCVVAALVASAAWFAAYTYFRPNWNWPLSLLFGAVFVWVFFPGGRAVIGKPAPFQLVLRLADDKGGDHEDAHTFETLHARFKHQFSKPSDLRFDGFDTDGRFIWFYFLGLDEGVVRGAVLAQLGGCRIRSGSYFLSKATQSCAPPNDGPTMPLGDQSVVEGPPSAIRT